MLYSFEHATLDDLIAFDRQLQELVQAGVPLQWSARSSTSATLQHSKRVVQCHLQRELPSVAVSTALEQSAPHVAKAGFWDVFEATPSVSPCYRLAFAAWVATERHPDSLMILKDIRSEHPSTNIGWVWSFYLKLLLVMAAGTLIFWQWTGGAALRELYQGSSFPPGPFGRVATHLNETFQDWYSHLSQSVKALGLAAIFIGIYFLFRTPKKNRNYRFWLPEESERSLAEMRFITTLRNLGIPAEQAVALMRRASSQDAPPRPASDWKPEEDRLVLSAKHWGTKRRIELQLHKHASTKPLLLYLGIGALVTLFLVVLVIFPVFEFISDLDVEKRF